MQNGSNPLSKIKVVKRLNPRLVYCLRFISADGSEFDIVESENRKVVEDYFSRYRSILELPNGAILVIVHGYLQKALAFNNRILLCGDQQGSENYATKSHMRAWADEAATLIFACNQMIEELQRDSLFPLPFDVSDEQGGGN